jgi:predicted nucleic acid-binding protein
VVIRLTLDVNVWFNNYWSFAHGKTGSAAQHLVKSCFEGSCRLGEIQPIISHLMLDTLQSVLVRQGFSERRAGAARDAVEAAATGGVLRMPPIFVMGGGTEPVMDEEDRSVLETAIVARSDLLVTSNMKDFTPGPRADINAQIIRLGRDGNPDVLLVHSVTLPHGLVIASVPAAHAWLVNGLPPPPGILQHVLPPATMRDA